jgi:hypothetical protein
MLDNGVTEGTPTRAVTSATAQKRQHSENPKLRQKSKQIMNLRGNVREKTLNGEKCAQSRVA